MRELGRHDPRLGALRHGVDAEARSPRRSAQRSYIRSSISLQSWASTPPSLALIWTMQSASSCSPVNRLRRSSWSRPRRISAIAVGDLRLLRLVVLLAGQLVEHLDVLELAARSSYVSMSSRTLAYSALSPWPARGRPTGRAGRSRPRARRAGCATRRPSGTSAASSRRRRSSRRSSVKSRIGASGTPLRPRRGTS